MPAYPPRCSLPLLLTQSHSFLHSRTHVSVFNIQAELHNPFGRRLIDMPHESTMHEMRQLAMRLMEDPRNCVPPDSTIHKGIAIIKRSQVPDHLVEENEADAQTSMANEVESTM